MKGKELAKLHKRRMLNIMTHLIVLLMIFILPEVIFSMVDRRPTPIVMYTHTVAYIATFYVSYFCLIDRFLFRKKTFTYVALSFLLALLMVVAMTLAQFLVHKYLYPASFDRKMDMWMNFDKRMLFLLGLVSRDFAMLVLTIGLSIAVKMSLRWAKIEKMNERMISERREMELRNLKNQLNPHFLFNTLNNIYALIAINADKAQEAVHELSKLLRYTLYENNESEVTLDKELLFMRSYIELMKLRLSSNNKLTVAIYDGPTCGLKIAPLLFISMVENAFKHGVSGSRPSNIDVSITLDGSTVCCRVENSLFPKKESDKSGSGIGLVNLSRQLSLLYESRYTFDTGIVGDRYVSELKIDLTPQK